MSSHGFSSVQSIVEEIWQGKMIIACDDDGREAEGDLMIAADLVTPEDINFMATHGRGLICLPMAPGIIERLQIPDMVERNEARLGTAFTASIEAREGVGSGISAADRARTIRVAVDPDSGPEDLVMPGHVFPLKARVGGVLERAGHTEAAMDLARLAGLSAAGVICEIMNYDGTMARVPDLERFALRHGLKMIPMSRIIEHCRRHTPRKQTARQKQVPIPENCTGHHDSKRVESDCISDMKFGSSPREGERKCLASNQRLWRPAWNRLESSTQS